MLSSKLAPVTGFEPASTFFNITPTTFVLVRSQGGYTGTFKSSIHVVGEERARSRASFACIQQHWYKIQSPDN